MLIDPPSGWRYGFPRHYDAKRDGDLGEFLLRHGYPADDIDFGLRHLRCIADGPEWSEDELEFIKNTP